METPQQRRKNEEIAGIKADLAKSNADDEASRAEDAEWRVKLQQAMDALAEAEQPKDTAGEVELNRAESGEDVVGGAELQRPVDNAAGEVELQKPGVSIQGGAEEDTEEEAPTPEEKNKSFLAGVNAQEPENAFLRGGKRKAKEQPTSPEIPQSVTAEVKNLSKEDREKIGLGLHNLGFWVEKKKSEWLGNTFNWVSKRKDAEWGKPPQGSLRRFLKGLGNSFKKDEEMAQKKFLANKAPVTTKLSNLAYFSKNIIRPLILTGYLTTGFTPAILQRLVLGSTMFGARVTGAAKEARLANEEVAQKTRFGKKDMQMKGLKHKNEQDELIEVSWDKDLSDEDKKDLERAQEEAQRVLRIAKERAGTNVDEFGNVSADQLKTAYLEEMPKDLQKRLQETAILDATAKGFLRNRIESNVNRLNIDIEKIEKDENLTPAKKQAKKDQLLRRWEKRLTDFDRVLSTTGEIDGMAMWLRYGEASAKNVARAATLLVSLGKAWELLSGAAHEGADAVHEISSPSPLPKLPDSPLHAPKGLGPIPSSEIHDSVPPETTGLIPDASHIEPGTAGTDAQHEIHRDGWYDNDTKNFDKNELKTHWGGENGLDKDGNYVLDVTKMTGDGSTHGELSANAQELLKEGKLKILLSDGSKGGQGFEISIDKNGQAVIDPNSEAGKLFFSKVNGRAQLTRGFAEVAEDKGDHHYRILSTVVKGEIKSGKGVSTVIDTHKDVGESVVVEKPIPSTEKPFTQKLHVKFGEPQKDIKVESPVIETPQPKTPVRQPEEIAKEINEKINTDSNAVVRPYNSELRPNDVINTDPNIRATPYNSAPRGNDVINSTGFARRYNNMARWNDGVNTTGVAIGYNDPIFGRQPGIYQDGIPGHGYYGPGRQNVLYYDNLTENDNFILQHHPEYGKDYFDIGGKKLIETYNISRQDIHFLFEDRPENPWTKFANLSAKTTLRHKDLAAGDVAYGRLFRYLEELKRVSGLEPKGPKMGIFGKGESVEEYVARALQKAMAKGTIDEMNLEKVKTGLK